MTSHSRRAAARWLSSTAFLLGGAGAASAQAVSSFQVTVPHRTGAAQLELSALKITIQLDASAPIGFSVSEAASGTLSTQAMDLTTAANDCFAGSVCFADLPNTPAGAASADGVIIIKPAQVGADPASAGNNKVVLLLRLRSNLNESSACTSTMSADETWTISQTGGGAGRIVGVSVQSLDKKTAGPGNPQCGTSFRPVPLSEPPLATVVGTPPILAGGRVGADVVMVLDRSGSMSSPAGPGAPPKIDHLRQAAGSFLDMWAALRNNECQNFNVTCPASGSLPGIQIPADSLGVVFFDNAFDWLKTLQPTSQIDGMKGFSTLTLATEKTAINGVNPRGSTSIGGGMLLGAGVLAPQAVEPNRKVILLMTDGLQNTNPLVQVSGSQVQTTNGGAPASLPNQPPIQVYTVSVGSGTGIDPTLLQNVATASNGLYLNSEVASDVLANFFLQVLQNSVKYATVETMRVVKDSTRASAPFEMVVPVTTTTRGIAFTLTWSRAGRSRPRVRLIPPGGATPIDFVATGFPALGSLTGNIAFPRAGLANHSGDWTVRVLTDSIGTDVAAPGGAVPFTLTLLGDDAALSSGLGPVRSEYTVGGTIKVLAQVNDFGKRLAGLGSQTGARVQVAVVRPGQSLGDVLSESTLQPAPATGTDTSSAAQRKLDAILAANPNALGSAANTVTLLDNGVAANGDSVANDGIYSALIQANIEGHYDLVFLVEGTSEAGGRFVRQAIRTVHVRSLPDARQTQMATAINQQVLVATFTPRNPAGARMGPGWQNYFWLVPQGGAPVKALDSLNGRYIASIPFTGSTPPTVTLYFLRDPVKRLDGFVPGQTDLKPADVVMPDITRPGGGGGGGGGFPIPWWLVVVIIAILLLLVLWFRRRSGP